MRWISGLLVFLVLLIIIAIVDAPSLGYTNQYNQSGEPYIALGSAQAGSNYNDLNLSGEGLTYNISEAQNGTQPKVAYYNFTNTTNNTAYKKGTDNLATPLPWANGWDGTDALAPEYTNLSVPDDNYADTFAVAPGNNKEPWWRFNFTLNMTKHPLPSIQWVYVEMELIKVGGVGEDCTFTIANFSASAWQEWAPRANITFADTYGSKNFTRDFGDIINSNNNQLVLLTNGINSDPPSEGCRVDAVNVSVGYNEPLYGVDVWHNSSPVSYAGTLTSVNATVRFNSTVAATYNLSIYNWQLGAWNATSCQGVNAVANTYYQLWCNVTQSPADYISTSNNVVRIRINNTLHTINGTLREDYVQYYISYLDTLPPRWRNNGSNTTDPLENESVLLFAQAFDEFLEYAVLQTNESGTWQNKSGYGSPMNLSGNRSQWVWSNFTWQNTSVLAGTQVSWRIWYNDSSGNWNMTEILNFTVQSPCTIALSLSSNLSSGINWTIASLPASNEPALGNNDTGNTTYNVTVTASGCNAALWIRANYHLNNSDDNFIGIDNETYRWNQTNATVPGAAYTSLTLDYANVTSPLSGSSTVYFKFFLNVLGGQAAGGYNNTVYFKANKSV